MSLMKNWTENIVVTIAEGTVRAPNILKLLAHVPDVYGVEEVYDTLFARHETTKALFVLDKNMSVRGSMLQQCFEVILDYAQGGDMYKLTLIAARYNHDGYGVQPEIFLDFFDAVRKWVSETLSELLDDTGQNILEIEYQCEWKTMISDFDQLLRDAVD